MRKRIGIHGASDETLSLVPLLLANASIEIVAVYDRDALGILERLPHLEPGVAALLEQTLGNEPRMLVDDPTLHAVIDSGEGEPFAALHPEVLERGLQVVSPLTGRLLWGLGVPSQDRQAELLQALHEVVESYNLTVDADELFVRMLEIAIGVTGAEGGSLMLLDPVSEELSVRVAVGVEPELWPKIRMKLGEGIAGRVAQEGRSLRLRGKADRQRFHVVRERLDVESALSVPLVREHRVLGVLNLHHRTRSDAFGEDDLGFVEELARLDAEIIARAQEHEALRSRAVRYEAVREVREIMNGRDPLPERLRKLCEGVAARAGHGIAHVYQSDRSEGSLRLAATSLAGGNLGGEYRVAPGEGIDGRVAQTGTAAFLRHSDGRLAYASLPLSVGGQRVGVLSVQAGSDPQPGPETEEILQEIANAAAEEMLSAQREARMESRAHVASAINEAGIRMISSTDPAEVLRLGTSAAAMVLEADHAVLRLQDEETRRYVIRSYFGSADGPLQERLFRLDKRVSVEVLKQRSPLLQRDLAEDPRFAEHASDVRSLLAAPLRGKDRVVGTLTLYDKMSADRFYAGSFSEEDAELFGRYVSYLERAIANAIFHEQARRFRNFDEDTGLPNQSYLAQRIREEIARSGPRDDGVALAVARIDNFEEIEGSGDPVKASRVVARVVDSLASHAREFDVVCRLDTDVFALLLPDPGADPARRILDLGRAVAEDVTKDERLNSPVRIRMSFGYAVHPEDGRDAEAMLSAAQEPRIHMV